MLFDAQKDDFKGRETTYDVCICGSGFAGITIARELAAKGKKVALLEAGGEDWSDASQDIYQGKTIQGDGLQYWDGLASCRLRYFGGTSNHWSGLNVPFDAVDFEQRDIYDLPNWPIKKSEFDPFFDRAADVIDITGKSFAAPKNDMWEGSKIRLIGSVMSPPTRLNEKYFSEISSANNKIDLILNCNLVDIRLDSNLSYVTKIITQNYRGQKFSFTAKDFVLACGAVENARLLLNCDSQISSGIGNHSDLVGRCFMEHLNVAMGSFVGEPKFWQGGGKLFKPTRDFIIKQRIGNSVLALNSDSKPKTYGRLRVLKRIIRDAVCSSDTLTNLSRAVSSVNCPGGGAISTLCEQVPNRNSRVMLGRKKDALGLRRVILDWQINNQDRKTLRTLAMTLAQEMARQDVGRIKLQDFLIETDKDIPMGAHCHQMGTTRMSEIPRDGVVDRNSRVHGMRNLYMAGSSIFPTGGGNNPTLAIVQLSLRLADHLLQR